MTLRLCLGWVQPGSSVDPFQKATDRFRLIWVTLSPYKSGTSVSTEAEWISKSRMIQLGSLDSPSSGKYKAGTRSKEVNVYSLGITLFLSLALLLYLSAIVESMCGFVEHAHLFPILPWVNFKPQTEEQNSYICTLLKEFYLCRNYSSSTLQMHKMTVYLCVEGKVPDPLKIGPLSILSH